MKLAPSLAGLILLLAGITSAQKPNGFEIERLSWLGTVPLDGGVQLKNTFGDVRARFGGYEGQIEVLATVQHFADGPRLGLDARETDAGVEVTVGYRDAASGEWIVAPTPGAGHRADLVVFVPLRTPLEVAATDGLIEAKGLRSDVRATTRGGEIRMPTVDGDVELKTRSGNVLLALAGRGSEHEQKIVSESGDLTLLMNAEAHATLRFATGGLVSSDFSAVIDTRPGRTSLRQGEAVVGKGTTPVTVTSQSGHIRLVRRPLAQKARMGPVQILQSLSDSDGDATQRGRRIATVDEDVHVEVNEPLVVRSQSGHVSVKVTNPAFPVDVTTVTGHITLLVDPAAGVAVELATSGEITSDYSLMLEYRYHEEPAKQARVAIGDGTTKIRLWSRRGTVSVLQRKE